MRVKLVNIPKLSPTFGYLIICIAATALIYPLAYDDWHTLLFALILLAVFIIGASMDTSGRSAADTDITKIGWTDKWISLSVPIGIIAGLIALFLGSLIMEFLPQKIGVFPATMSTNMALLSAALIPDYSGIKTASVIQPYMAVGANVIAQWFVVAPSEESLSKILLSWGGMSLFKNLGIAYLFGTVFWTFIHIPTLLQQNASSAMYLVLLMLGGVTLLIYSITKSLFSSIIAHATFNTGVILLGSQINYATYVVVLSIIGVLVYIWFSAGRNGKATAKRS